MEDDRPGSEDLTRSLTTLLDDAPFTTKHRNIWALSSMGILLDGFDLFVLSVAMPLIIQYFGASAIQAGLVGAAATFGAIFGAVIGGTLTDRFGRQKVLMIDLAIFVLFAICSGFSWSLETLFLFRFLLGVGIGADYPICASYVSEFMPRKIRGRMLIGAFSFQAVGIFLAAATGLCILLIYPHETAWRLMLLVGAVPGFFILIMRRNIPESARWHIKEGDPSKAAKIICNTIHAIPTHITDCIRNIIHHDIRRCENELQCLSDAGNEVKQSIFTLFRPEFRRRTLLATVPWFIMDVVFYGVGLFTPLLLVSMAFSGKGLDLITSDYLSTEGTAFLDIFLILGFILNIVLIERMGRMRLQVIGFTGMAVGLVMLMAASMIGNPVSLIFAGFIIYNVLMNMGPNATTFIVPAELFPTELRATAHGFAAGTAKLGAAIGIILVPVLKETVGIFGTLGVMLLLILIAIVITLLFRVETTGLSLEDLT